MKQNITTPIVIPPPSPPAIQETTGRPIKNTTTPPQIISHLQPDTAPKPEMDSLHLNQSAEIPPIHPNRVHEDVTDFDFFETSTATFANMTTIRGKTSEVNSYLNDSANKNPSPQPTPIDKKELSEIMAPIMQTLHEQYKQNLEIQHENELAKEIRQIYCQVSVLRRIQAVTLSQTNGLLQQLCLTYQFAHVYKV
ncbi:hypothetical protein DAPPUDRAFT_263952 [Daphnia pulex]|uniref:Uncharacterized protein n=1 Tax=Daphnia pulex TaxID=6669 RepID=E9HQN3_DAPPU|nr:hypothetical protein DAPPUDRAFT_263952 [Daphnia pulex]|eukprot:EFX65958.1 hypothetical protein DAPPUDRAFT_263952 [Daphnia pulex]